MGEKTMGEQASALEKEYPHKVWVLWDSDYPEEGSALREESFGKTPSEVLTKANSDMFGNIDACCAGFDRAQLMHSKLPYAELQRVKDRKLYITEIGPTVDG